MWHPLDLIIISGLILDLCTTILGQGVITLVTTEHQVAEGQHFNVDVRRSGISGSDIVVIVEVNYS